MRHATNEQVCESVISTVTHDVVYTHVLAIASLQRIGIWIKIVHNCNAKVNRYFAYYKHNGRAYNIAFADNYSTAYNQALQLYKYYN